MTRTLQASLMSLGIAILPAAVLAKSPVKMTFTAVLNGGQVVPPSSSNALGVGFLTFESDTKRLCYSISYSGLEGIETEAHVHAGDSGQSNAVLYDLTPLTSPKLGCIGPLRKNEEALLKKGQMYINIHTDVWVAGELRGQVLPVRGVH